MWDLIDIIIGYHYGAIVRYCTHQNGPAMERNLNQESYTEN